MKAVFFSRVQTGIGPAKSNFFRKYESAVDNSIAAVR
jgi:hypothetical protein